MFRKLGFRHGGVIYTSDSFSTLKAKALETGAHRLDGEPGTGVDLRKIITPIDPDLHLVLASDFEVQDLDAPEGERLPGLDRETATAILADMAADAVKDEREAEQWIGATTEDPSIQAEGETVTAPASASYSPEQLADGEAYETYRADRIGWEDAPFPADNLVFFCPQEPGAAEATRILFKKVLATVNAGRTVHLEAASNPSLRHRCFYVITDRVDA